MYSLEILPMFQFYNKETDEHFYTSDTTEILKIIKEDGFIPELFGPQHNLPAFCLSKNKTEPFVSRVYRLNAPRGQPARHMWTVSVEERDKLVKEKWREDPYEAYAATDQASTSAVPIYRLYNEKNKQHIWTAFDAVRQQQEQKGWTYEEIAFYAIANTRSTDLPDWLEDDYLNSIGGRRSKEPNSTKIDLIQKCCPIWLTAQDEDYQPMDWLSYRGHCVKEWNFDDAEGVVNIEPKRGDEYYSKDGKKNPNRFTSNLLVQNGHFKSADGPVPLTNPKSAPTFAFYQEMDSGFIWIRYFLFFGYNTLPFPVVGTVAGNHYAEWVHIAVELKSVGESYLPNRYFFSQHSEGTTHEANDPRLDFYDLEETGEAFKFSEQNFSEAKNWHIGVFCARGTHECYADTGIPGRDITSYGAAIAPFIPQLCMPRKTVPPLFAWDMTKVTRTGAIPMYENARFLEWEPETVLPDAPENPEFFNFNRIFCKQQKGRGALVPVNNCGKEDTVLSDEINVKSPALKIFEWGKTFEN